MEQKEKRTLGASGLALPRLGLGLAALGRPGYINLGHADDLNGEVDAAAMEARSHAVLDAAWEAGIRYFDAARSYGRAEHFLASWLNARGIRPLDAAVGSKWGYAYTAGWQTDAEVHEVKEHSLQMLQRQWSESRLLLGGHLDLYQIHSATPESGVLDNTGVLDELARLRAQGIRIGLSVSGPAQAVMIRRAMKIVRDGERLFDAVQATWNLLEPSAGAALHEASEAGIGVIVKEALANGRLTGRNRQPGFAMQRAVLEAEAARLSTTIDALAIAAALAQPWAAIVLSGAATAGHLRSNIKAASVEWDGTAAARLALLAETPRSYWSTRGSLSWN